MGIDDALGVHDHATADAGCDLGCCDGLNYFLADAASCVCPRGTYESTPDACRGADAGLPPMDATCFPEAGFCCDGAATVPASSICPFECPEGSVFSRTECAPLMCPEVRADASCVGSQVMPAGEAFTLPVEFHQCACCADTECAVRVDTRNARVELTTTMCPDPCDCDRCEFPTVGCDVPALSVGDWTAVVNGEDAFRFTTDVPRPGFAPPPPWCIGFSQPDACGIGSALDARTPAAVDEVCVGRTAEDKIFATLVDHCRPCGSIEGTCSVILDPRYTDDLPPGGEIRINATQHQTSCDIACPDICIRDEQACRVPDLVPGDVYRVWIDGRVVDQFVWEPGATSCATIDRDE